MSKSIIFGYARISTMKQRIERQMDNINREYPGRLSSQRNIQEQLQTVQSGINL